MRTSLRIVCGLVPLVAWLMMSGCSGKAKTSRTASVASTPAPVSEAQTPPEESAPIETVVPALEPIHFAFNEHRITPEAELALQNVSVVMKRHPGWTILLEGHCDERGTSEYNIALGESRAVAAKSYLVSLGIDGDRVETASYGEDRPVDRGTGEASWAKNRRAEFRPQRPQS